MNHIRSDKVSSGCLTKPYYYMVQSTTIRPDMVNTIFPTVDSNIFCQLSNPQYLAFGGIPDLGVHEVHQDIDNKSVPISLVLYYHSGFLN